MSITTFCDILDLGIYGNCDEVTVAIVANNTDLYTLEYLFMGALVRKKFSATAGDNIQLEGGWFNETAQVSIKLYSSQGVALTIDELDELGQVCKTYDEFKIQFAPQVSMDKPLSDCCYCA